MRNLAKVLSACEARRNEASEAKPPASFPVCDKLRPHLATLVGNAGYRALLSRALALAAAEVRWLRDLRVKADGSFEGLEASHAKVPSAEFIRGRSALLAQLLELLVAFIGENLTLRLVREIWPNVPIDDLNLDGEGKNEKTK